MKNIILLLSVICITNISVAQNSTIQCILNNVRIDSIMYFVEELSGKIPTVINGVSRIIPSRHKDEPGNELAFIYIKQKLSSYSLQPDSQQFSASGKNIFAVQTGSVYPNKKYIICAHYDDMPESSLAPGADDNASGTAAVIEAARILSRYSFPYTIVYALWDEEEQGLVGSGEFAVQAVANDDSIMGVINLDMIAWDSDNDSLAYIHTFPVGNSLQLKDIMNSVNSTYNIGLNIVVQNPGTFQSDHASFWWQQYSAIGLTEDYSDDFNTYYHSYQDLTVFFNIPYYEKVSKLAMATLACLALDSTVVLLATTTTSDATFGNCDGTATVSVCGGDTPLTYLWDDTPDQTTAMADSLCPGTYTVTITDSSGSTTTAMATVGTITGIPEANRENRIDIYPNPFSYNTTINYSLPFQCKVNISIYNSLGNKIEEFVAQEQQAGNYEISWDAAGSSSGIYFCELSAISTNLNKVFRKVKKLNIVR
ncbi:MAG: M28 family peptidase [Bacteroidota bacterium]